ncbi:MAG: ATP-binding cassette domain-containing protein, partial [Clostridium sp.]
MLTLNGITKEFGKGEIILKDINLEVKEGEFVSILGPSGCGKSTLLNIIARINKEYTGTCENKFKKTCVMFQEGGLLPWLNVYENVEFALKDKIKD